MSTLRVFVVDPDEQRAAWLERLTAAHGHEVIRFDDGERAIDAFVQRPADAILVEYVLPGRDGVATIEAIRWAPGGRDVRVVLLAREEPATAPLQMLALRVDAHCALVGELDEQEVERALADLERDWDDEGTLALGDDSYAHHLKEARRQSVPTPPPPQPLPAPRPAMHGWLDVATVIAGAVRVETVESQFGDETTRGGDASVARAIGIGPSPVIAPGVPDRPLATFDDVTTTEVGEGVSSAATVSARPLDASAARAILGISGGRITGRIPTAHKPTGASTRFAAPVPTSSFRAPTSSGAAASSGAFASSSKSNSSVPPPRSPSVIEGATGGRRAEVSTRQISAPREELRDRAPSAFAEPEALDARAAPLRAAPSPMAAPLGPSAGLVGDDGEIATMHRLAADPQSLDEGRFVRERARESAVSEWSGSFSDTPFPALLRRIADERASGGLVCTMPAAGRGVRASVDGEVATKVVFFRGGVPVHVRSNVVDECLGQLLLRKKRIGLATLEESIRRMHERGGLQGQILVEMGALSPIDLGELLSEQVRQKLFDLFGWRRGEFRFARGMEAPRDGVALEMALPDMVYEGVCAAMPATLLLDIMTPRLESFVVPDPVRLSRFARVRVAKDLRQVLERLDGATRLRDVLRTGSRPGAIAQLLYALECLGAVAYEAHAQPRRIQLPPLSLEHALDPPAPPPSADDASWDDVTNERVREKSARVLAETRAPRELEADGAPTMSPRELAAAVQQATAHIEALGQPPHAAIPSESLSSFVERSGSDEVGAFATGGRPALAPDGRALDAHVDRMFEAERCFRRGNRCLAKSDHREALAAFTRAVELCPDEGEFVAYLGWARYCTDPTSYPVTENALADLVRATTLAPDLHLTHLLHARVLDHAGRTAAALTAYREVLALEPAMPEAVEALGRLAAR